MPAFPASQVPERSRRGAGPAGPEGGPDKPALFHGFIWACGRAAASTATDVAIKTTRRGRIAEPSSARGLYAHHPAELRPISGINRHGASGPVGHGGEVGGHGSGRQPYNPGGLEHKIANRHGRTERLS